MLPDTGKPRQTDKRATTKDPRLGQNVYTESNWGLTHSVLNVRLGLYKGSMAVFLRDYRVQKGLSRPQFAAMIGSSDRALVKWEKGDRTPGLEAIASIEYATGGAVTWRDWLEQKRSRRSPIPPAPAEQDAAA